MSDFNGKSKHLIGILKKLFDKKISVFFLFLGKVPGVAILDPSLQRGPCADHKQAISKGYCTEHDCITHNSRLTRIMKTYCPKTCWYCDPKNDRDTSMLFSD